MPWLAAHDGGWPHWTDPGSELEAVYRRLGYCDTAAPGPDGAPESPSDLPPAAELGESDQPKPPPRPRRRRSARP